MIRTFRQARHMQVNLHVTYPRTRQGCSSVNLQRKEQSLFRQEMFVTFWFRRRAKVKNRENRTDVLYHKGAFLEKFGKQILP